MRAKNIDILKAVCAFLIVCIHIPFPGGVGEYFTSISRIAVPIFFMITGYFYSDVTKKKREIQQIKKILKLVIEANLLYFLWSLFIAIANKNMGTIFNVFTVNGLMNFLLFNQSPFGYHLWYLGAILYVLLIIYLADKMNCRNLLYVFTPFLLMGDIFWGNILCYSLDDHSLLFGFVISFL